MLPFLRVSKLFIACLVFGKEATKLDTLKKGNQGIL